MKFNIANYSFDITSEHAEKIQKCLLEGTDVSIYTKPEFDGSQIREIQKGLEKGINVSIYAKPEFNNMQMYEIRTGLERGASFDDIFIGDSSDSITYEEEVERILAERIDVSIYAKPEFDHRQMTIIYLSIQEDMDISTIVDSILKKGR